MASRDSDKSSPFKVLPGGRGSRDTFCGIPLILAPDDHSPLAVDALVCEEDRFLVLSSALRPDFPAEHPLRVINQAWNQAPLAVGSVHFRPGRPARFLAVVHDLDRTPSFRPIWLLAALAALREELRQRPEIRTLGLPLIGMRYGHLPASEALNLLRQAMSGSRWPLDEIRLLVPRQALPQVGALLD